MKRFFGSMVLATLLFFQAQSQNQAGLPAMYYADTVRTGVPFSKDPHVVWFKGSYLMYYSVPGSSDGATNQQGWGIGVAKSSDLIHWKRVGEVNRDPAATYEAKGFCAPGGLVIGDTVHLFYQTYGNGKNDAICHAWSTNGIDFTRNPTNPIFQPSGNWTCGRAIDAEVIRFRGQYFLYFATRDPDFKIQMQGVAVAPGNSRFNRDDWRHVSTDGSILKPEFPWEQECIEGASVVEKNGTLYMFYAGAYNNSPQQVGVATSTDGIRWKRLFTEPFLANGRPGEWNASESGHPHIFTTPDGRNFLFFQGNNTKGKDWFLSNVKVVWDGNLPKIEK